MLRININIVLAILLGAAIFAAAFAKINSIQFAEAQQNDPGQYAKLWNGFGYGHAKKELWRADMDRYVWSFEENIRQASGLAVTSFALSCLIIVNRWRRKPWRTLPKPIFIFILPSAVCAMIAGAWFAILRDFNSRYLPHWADSLGIPLFQLISATYILVPIALIVSIIVLVLGHFPSNMFPPSNGLNIRSTVANCGGGIFVLFGALGSIDVFSIPGGLLFVLFGLQTRAALLAKGKLVR